MGRRPKRPPPVKLRIGEQPYTSPKAKARRKSIGTKRDMLPYRKAIKGAVNIAVFVATHEQFQFGPVTLDEMFKSHLQVAGKFKARGKLDVVIDILKYGVEHNSDSSGVRFADESLLLSDECMEEYLLPFKSNLYRGEPFMNTRAPGIDQICVKVLCNFSVTFGNNESCVCAGVEKAVSSFYLKKFVGIVGEDAPNKASMTSEQNEERIAKTEMSKKLLLEERHKVSFPKIAPMPCAVHKKKQKRCLFSHLPRATPGLHIHRIRLNTSSPICDAWIGAGVSLGHADDSEFSILLHLIQRIVEAESRIEDFFV